MSLYVIFIFMLYLFFFFFNDTATTEIYTLSLHDALPLQSGRTQALRRRFMHARQRPGGHARLLRVEKVGVGQVREALAVIPAGVEPASPDIDPAIGLEHVNMVIAHFELV